jgi:uncharacterized NAD(P)/FAD-binding protein YdhS/quercetin dioxygenase-like cupin family protein
VRFGVDNYSRNLIAKTPSWELRLLCWRPGQGTSLHGHSRAACAFTVLRGTATECVLGARDRTWTPGAIVTESTPLVHQLTNLGSDSMVSLHAYSPPLPADQPSPAAGRNVVIIGGGLAGAAAAVHLLQRLPSAARVTVIERGPLLGRGVAYAVESPSFRLNVPASRMSLDAARPDDFVRFAGAQAAPQVFLPRVVYGRYVEHALERAVRAAEAKLRVVRSNAVAITAQGVQLADGRVLPAEAVVLATGLEPRRSARWLSNDPRIVDAWDECALATLPADGRVLVLGSGLTAVDVVTMLHQRGFSGAIDVLSPRGLWPRPHAERVAPAPELSQQPPARLRPLMRWVRERIETEPAWQGVVDSLRPHVAGLWRGLESTERSRFVRHLRPYWDIVRHRMPADAHALIEELRRSGALALRAGRVVEVVPSPGALEVTARLRGGEVTRARYDAVVRCLGPALTRAETDEPLLSSLLTSGAATVDAAGLGIVTDTSGRLVPAREVTRPHLFALGALRRASEWETTSVPDISRHAAAIAEMIAECLK